MVWRWASLRRGERIAAIAIALVCFAALLVVVAAERGVFTPAKSVGGNRMSLPGITLDDDDDDGPGGDPPMPVVTSLRTDGQAERLGVRVGDHIAAIDGRPVRDVAALRAALQDTRGHKPVALHILRGSAVWNVAIDRAEPPIASEPAGITEKLTAHGP
jgi:S1-C subfamily serine protease